MHTILLIASIFGFVLTTLLFSKKSTNRQATFFLGSFYFLLSIYALQTYIVDSGQLANYPFFFLWPLIPYNLFCVPIYFYFQTIMDDRFKWKTSYLLLFIPFILGIIDVSSIYMQPNAIYNSIFQAAVSDPTDRLHVHYWLLSLKQHFLMRHIWQLAVLLILFPKLLTFFKVGKGERLKMLLNKWLLFFWAILIIMGVFAIIYAFEDLTATGFLYIHNTTKTQTPIVHIILYLVVFATGILPMYFPSITQGYPKTIKTGPDAYATADVSSELKYGLELAVIENKLAILTKNKHYLQPDFNVTSCARDLELPAHHLSYFLSQQYGLSFTAYKNTLRMEDAKRLIETGFLETNTIEALAWKCGFADRSSFGKVFRNCIGISPSDYLLKIQENE